MRENLPVKNSMREQYRNLYFVLAGLFSTVLLATGLYLLWLGDPSRTPYLMAGIGFIVLTFILGFVGFSRKRAGQTAEGFPELSGAGSMPAFGRSYVLAARAGLVVVSLITAGMLFLSAQHRQELEKQLIILVTRIDGPTEVTDLRDGIIEYLNNEFSGSSNVMIKGEFEEIPASEGSASARLLGKLRLADMVVWGAYDYREDPNLSITVESMAAKKELSLSLKEKQTSQEDGKLAELESTILQFKVGENNSALYPLLAGYAEYRAGNYENAIKYFDLALENLSDTGRLPANKAAIIFYRANANFLLGSYEAALQDYDRAIETGSPDKTVYLNRGSVYQKLGRAVEAEADFARYKELGG